MIRLGKFFWEQALVTLLMTALHCNKGVSDTIRRLNFCREDGEGSEFEYRQEGESLVRYRCKMSTNAIMIRLVRINHDQTSS